MFLALCSVKGGVGTTVLSAAVALAACRAASPPPLLVDLGGDLPTVLGAQEARTGGVAEWSRAAARPDSPARLLQPIGGAGSGRLDLLRRGAGPIDAARLAMLGQILRTEARTVVVDVGTHRDLDERGPLVSLLDAAERRVLVTGTCVAGLRRARGAPPCFDGVAVVRERHHVLRTADIAAALALPVLAHIERQPSVARAVDAGVLAARLPRALRDAATSLLDERAPAPAGARPVGDLAGQTP
jgi:hypothetical protein